jgi:hypothetical protein
MKRSSSLVCVLLGLFAFPCIAAPATACASSRPLFTADPVDANGRHQVEVLVRSDEALLYWGRQLGALRATVLGGSGITPGTSIVIIVPDDSEANCNYAGLADEKAVVRDDGSLEGYVVLIAEPESSGAYSSNLATSRDRLRYSAFAEGRIRGHWVRRRFSSGDKLSEGPTPPA